MNDKPNILLLMSDQHRGDCLGARSHPVVRTPHLDSLAASGINFTHAYSANALCAPARRTLLSGQKASRHGVLDSNGKKPLVGPTLPGLLSEHGFQTHLIGKLHLWPRRTYYGFATADWADWIDPRDENDYTNFIRDRDGGKKWIVGKHAFHQNSRRVCAWALDDELHYNNWCADSALNFLKSRNAQQSFFLMVSFIPPHPPLFPLPRMLDKYLAMEIPEPRVGDWSMQFADPPVDDAPIAWHGSLQRENMRKFRAAYFASIEHVDNQIGRIIAAVPENTLVIYLSDHGDMLGDHYLFQKRAPYEAAVNIPFILRFPETTARPPRRVVDHAVELMDVMPTLLDFADIPIPETVDGQSLMPLVANEPFTRSYLHGENTMLPSIKSGMQFITDGRWKYIWYPERNWEQLFHLENDPGETVDLAPFSHHQEVLASLRQILISELTGRAEGFTDGERLLPRVGARTSPQFVD